MTSEEQLRIIEDGLVRSGLVPDDYMAIIRLIHRILKEHDDTAKDTTSTSDDPRDD